MIEVNLNLDDVELILTKLIEEKQTIAELVEKQPWRIEQNKKLIKIENLINLILNDVKNSSQKNEKVSQA